MKAIYFEKFGGPEVLQFGELPTPIVGPDDVLVRVHAVSVNRTLDLAVRSDQYIREVKLPHILGVDPSGVVVATGERVKDRKPEDRVWVSMFVPTDDKSAPVIPEFGHAHLTGVTIWGGYAEYVCVPAAITQIVPDHLSFADATVIARHTPTALNLIENCGAIKPGEWILVMGASGGLGNAAVQVARQAGATVIAAAGADDRVETAMKTGAHHGINYRQRDLTAEVMKLTDGQGVDVVCENVGDPDLWNQAFNSLAVHGRLVTAGAHAGTNVDLNLRQLYLRRIRIIGDGSEAPGGTARAFRLAAEGKLKPLIDRILPLSQAAEAHRYVAARSGIGKVVLDPTAG